MRNGPTSAGVTGHADGATVGEPGRAVGDHLFARLQAGDHDHALADDGTQYAPGQAVVTPRVIRGELLSLFRELEQAGLVENFDQFKADLLVVRSNQDRSRVNAVIPPDIINQFRVFAAAVQFRL